MYHLNIYKLILPEILFPGKRWALVTGPATLGARGAYSTSIKCRLWWCFGCSRERRFCGGRTIGYRRTCTGSTRRSYVCANPSSILLILTVCCETRHRTELFFTILGGKDIFEYLFALLALHTHNLATSCQPNSNTTTHVLF